MPNPIFRGVSPDTLHLPQRYNVVGPKRGSVLDATVLGTDILGVPTHWADDEELGRKRSWLCDGRGIGCAICGVEKLQPLYFVAAWDHVAMARIILRLGPEGAASLAAVAGRVGTVRGLRVEITDTMTNEGRAVVCVESRKHPLIPLVSAHVIDPIVARLLKVAALPGWLTMREMPGGAS